ncbi:MAG: DNA-formamidopyrimidine glycosylase [Peptococcaceae bacterium]|nr:DNA-formamidopyrimidine glycosylase [Peptococcaceae bacterium]
MPELPEVETIRQSLTSYLQGLTIEGCQVTLPKLVKNMAADDFMAQLKGRTIREIGRRGKYLIFKLSRGYTLVVHLRMTGQLRFCASDVPRPAHTHVVLEFSPDKELRYTDTRQFGAWFLAPDGEIGRVAGIDRLGVEPLSPEFTVEQLGTMLSLRRGKIKAVLLNQHIVAGIGNIYADEALFAAGIHPERVASTLTPRELAALHFALQALLTRAIELRGTSVRDYVDGSGLRGNFQTELKVYGRTDGLCRLCDTPLLRLVVAGRSTHLCPHCQI